MGSNTLEEKLTEERLDEITSEAEGDGIAFDGFIWSSVREAVQKAFELGKNKQKKKINDNPYNIDYERQTKLEL